MGILTGQQKRIVGSLQVQKICEFILKDVDEETRCKMLIETLRVLEARGRPDKALMVVEKLDKEDKLMKNFCGEIIGEIIRDKNWDPQLVRTSADITARRLLAPDEVTLSATCDWLQSNCAVTMLESITRTNGKKLMEILVKEAPRIVCHLLHRVGQVRKDTLDLLKIVATGGPCPMKISHTISDIFEDCVHSERWTEIANDILEITNIVNPIDPPKETIRVDTAYLMNWCQKKGYFSDPISMSIQDLIGELCGLITCSPVFECFQEIMELNRTVDLLMFLDQGTKRYRGHDIHQFNVAALGLFFLDTHVKNNSSLKDYVASVHQDQFPEPGDVKKAWLLASLLHDHALPITHMFEIAPVICKIIDEGGRDSYKKALGKLRDALRLAYGGLFSKRLLRVYSFFATGANYRLERLEKLISKEMSKIGLREIAMNKLDHGVLGAVNITSRFKNAPLDKNVEVSAKAIAVHNMKDKKISFKKDPLAFLLVMCDELQEWGREIAVFPEILIDASSMTMGKFHIDGGKRFFTDDLHVSFRFLRNTELTKFNEDFFTGQKTGFFNERLDFDDCDVFPPIHFDKPTFGM